MTTILIAVFVLSYLLTGAVCRFALASQLLDIPNPRSSHRAPTPSGGGVAIVSSWFAGSMLLGFGSAAEWQQILSILPPALIIAFISFIDDKIGVSAGTRFVVHGLCAAWFIILNGAVPSTGLPMLDNVPLLMAFVCVFGLVWLTNLYNFMDGIDGLAGAQAVFYSVSMSAFSFMSGAQNIAAFSAILAASCTGFLIWNWPPARIFMGDTGSSCLGFIMGAMALYVSGQTEITVWTWIILLGVFLVDATVTLMRRIVSGQRWYEAHRSHTYQILSRRWNSHRRVTVVVSLVNIGWLLPMAVAAYLLPDRSLIIATIALAPLVGIAVNLGAGQLEAND